MPGSLIPALLVTGMTGAGKTTYLSKWLSSRPQGERWAVLLNDFGDARLAPDGDVFVREVAGCICCSAQVSLRTAIVALLRTAPARLLIEASASARPSSIVSVLKEPGIAAAVALERIVCIVDPAHAIDPRYAGLALYREQVRTADVIILAKRDLYNDAPRAAAREALASLGSAPVDDL